MALEGVTYKSSDTFYCATCNAPERVRERRINGNSICLAGHEYPSSKARRTKAPVPAAKQYPTPTEEGFYWAKWRIAEDGSTTWIKDTPPSLKWEVVEVWQPSGERDQFSVNVSGEEKLQSLDNFFWGPGPLEPPKE